MDSRMLDEEKRRYFRIEDTISIKFELLNSEQAAEREEEMRLPGYHSPNRIQIVERELQLLIDKLRIQTPELAKAIELMNIKLSIMKESYLEDITPRGRKNYIRNVSLSACGVSFENDEQIKVGEKIDMDLTLLPTDLHIFTLGEVVGCRESEENLGGWMVRVDFYGMPENDEELMVQHIVKRQGQLLANRRKNKELR
ncbi:MAG: c-di-GMP-binding flagellar brake protein YcgR [Candidatus Azotimanducaceae bacterium]|jgi:c-di-GMP-binding flagellar brake protein YcgR